MCTNSHRKKLSQALIWSWLSLGIRSGAQLIVLPFALVNLGPESMGFWYVFIGIGAFLLKLEFGLNPCISRAFAFILAGSSEYLSNNTLHEAREKEHIGEFIGAVCRLYQYIVVLAILVLVPLTWWIIARIPTEQSRGPIVLAWFLFSLSTIISIWGNVWIALLTGVNRIDVVQKSLLISGVVYVLTTLLCFHLGLGLMALSVGALSGAIVGRGACWFSFRVIHKDFIQLKRSTNVAYWMNKLWPTVWRTGLMDLGACLIYFSNILLASTYLPMSVAASYGLTFQVFQLGFMACGLPLVVCIPALNQSFAKGNRQEAWAVFWDRHITGLFLYVAFVFGVIFIGPYMLSILGSKTVLLDNKALFLFSIIMLLEFNHGYFATFLMSSNKIPFVGAALISGIAIAVVGWLMVQSFGVFGLLIGVGVVQLSWNNWWVPYKVFKEIGIKGSPQ